MDKLRKLPAWSWVLIFGAVIALARVGSFGFWDPWELKLAEQANDIATSSNLFDPSVDRKYAAAMPLQLVLPALGLKLLGANELGGRLFNALAAMMALFGVYWAGVGLFRRRAALLAVLALGSMTMFVLEARQITSDMLLIAALAWAVGGLGRWAWPPAGQRKLRDLAVAAAALCVAFLSGGAAVGVLAPCLAVVAALLVGGGLRPVTQTDRDQVQDGSRDLCDPGVGPDQPADRSLLGGTFGGGYAIVFWGLVAAVLALTVAVFARTYATGKLSMMLGGVPRSGTPPMFEYLVRQLGFGLFPWSALAVFALARPLIRLDEADGGRTNGRLAFGQLLMLFATAFGFALSTYFVLMVGEARFVMLAPVALALGAFLDEALDGQHSEPVVGLIAATGTMLVARDIFMDPHELVSTHLLAKVRWPQSVGIGYGILLIAFVVGLGIYTGLAARGRALGHTAGAQPATAPRGWRGLLSKAVLLGGRWGLQAAVASAVLFAVFMSQALVPILSKHYSMKPVMESYSRFAKNGEEVGKYRIEGQGSAFLGGRKLTELKSQDQLLAFLRKPNRVFALVPTEDLAALDAAFKLNKLDYVVMDAASSKFLLISNLLGQGEKDDNPLKKDVWMSPNFAQNGEWSADDRPPWTWRLNLGRSFDGRIELLGANMPETVRRPGKLPLELFFRVKSRVPSAYKIFVHLDGPATPRLIGDHDPLQNAFPTTYWYPGEYIRDRYDVDVPLMTTPAGRYTVYMGFWPGGEGKRLKVTQGEQDGSDRVRVGTLEIK